MPVVCTQCAARTYFTYNEWAFLTRKREPDTRQGRRRRERLAARLGIIDT